MDLLVGPGGDDEGNSLSSCAGGLLGQEIGGKNIFNYPIFGITACSAVKYLKGKWRRARFLFLNAKLPFHTL
jgi:hypothetical protein